MSSKLITPFSSRKVNIEQWDARSSSVMEAAYAFPQHHHPQLVHRAVQEFNAMMRTYTDVIKGLASGRINFSSEEAFPSLENQGIPSALIFNTSQRQVVDTRWTQLYSITDKRTSRTPLFAVDDTYTNVTFQEYDIGQPIESDGVEGEQNYYKMKIYAGMYQYNKMWEMWQDMWSEEEGLTAMAMRYARQQAKIAYQTITTATGLTTVAHDAATNAVEADINTINAGITTIQTQLYNATTTGAAEVKEEDVSQGTFALLYNNLTAGYHQRIAKALEARLDANNDNQSVGFVMNPVVPIGSPDIPTGTWCLTLLRRKNVFAIGRDLQIMPVMNAKIAGVNQAEVGQGAYRAVRDDDDQTVLLALS